jgi:hypothetical protein
MAGSLLGPSTPQIPAAIVVRAVAILFPIGFVVLPIVGNQVIQRESIMAGNKVDGLLGGLPPGTP